ncbi:hypothetical protein [Herminiimonas contaminans]|uniref:Phage tail assembly chaperone n=1 Tax=Herminiimonas contaminans TaxID=1111140 RepID=A0ABS0ES36_9BURK|nr:hypothetical protein [Herminiimonas contaminans]MBF8177651.1 hypothetical protein [Herminiimonas contaminans]
MPYIQRDSAGLIVGRYAVKQFGYAEEFIYDDAPELQPTQEQIITEKIKVMDDLIKARLNAKAVEMRFDSIASAIAAASLPAGEYRQEDGAALHLWSARTWQKAEQIRDAFLSGERPEPSWEEVEAELPSYPII